MRLRGSGPTSFLSLVLGVCGALGCGGPGGSHGGSTVATGPEPCPTGGELRLGRICWSPVGSRWHLTAMAPGGEYAFDVELLPANRLRSTDHPAAGPGTDEWFADGNTLRLFLADRFVEYRADVTNGTVMVGNAVNARGESWEWRGDRMQIGGGCGPDEAEIDGTCFAMAGTRWRVTTSRGAVVVHFAPEGRLLVDQGTPSESNRWSQEGATLRFTLDGQEHSATITGDASRLSGNGWSAEREPLYPPPMH
jgi:hypothetical protein